MENNFSICMCHKYMKESSIFPALAGEMHLVQNGEKSLLLYEPIFFSARFIHGEL